MTVKIDTTARIEKIRVQPQGAFPAGNPESGYGWLYFITGSANGGMYFENDAGMRIGPFITGSSSSSSNYDLLAMVYNTGGGNKTTTSATQADVDATNAAITFIAPASGNIVVQAVLTANTDLTANANAFLGIRESTTDIVNKQFAIQAVTATALELLINWETYITGVSPGSHTYKLAFAVNSNVAFTVRASSVSPMILRVWARP